MIDRAAIYEAILRRNALRHEAGLPELPVTDTYRQDFDYASWREYARQHGARVRAEVLAQQRARYGADWPTSGGGWMAYSCLVAKALAKNFAVQRST